MNNLEKYNEVFVKTFLVSNEELDTLEYQSIDAWDSVGHMELIVELEEAFGISFEPDDMMNFTTYKNGIEILKRHGIEIQ